MTEALGIAPAGQVAVGGLALLGVLLFVLAWRRGRWGFWVAGYLLVVAALAVAFLVRHPAPGGAEGGAGTAPAEIEAGEAGEGGEAGGAGGERGADEERGMARQGGSS